jgi:ADP-ribosylglycohydrolase
MTTLDNLRDRVYGTLVGLAAGDRNGGPIRMAIHLGKSIVQKKRFDRDDVLDHYFDWWKREGFDTGPVAEGVFTLITRGTMPQDAVLKVHKAFNQQTAGCNPAHRSAPLAMAGFIPDEQLSDSAHQEAALTHFDPLAGDISSIVVYLCRSLIRGEEWNRAIEQVVSKSALNLLQASSTGNLKRGGFAPDVLQAALYFLNTSTSFEDALTASIQFAGDNNYCPVLVGSIGGARWGRGKIPDSALEHCQKLLPEIEAVVEALGATWN